MSHSKLNPEHIFEVIAVYFTNCYYNDLYKHAVTEWQNKKFKTLDDAYRTTINQYNKAFYKVPASSAPQNKNYFRIINDIKNRYEHYLDHKTTLGGFIDIICRCILPADVYNKMPRQGTNKDKIFRRALTKAVSMFTVYIVKNGISTVLGQSGDKHPKKSMNKLKEHFIGILTGERDELYSIHMSAKSGIPIDKNTTAAPKALQEAMARIKKLIKEKAALINIVNTHVDRIKKMTNANKEKDDIILKLQKQLPSKKSRRRRREPVIVVEPRRDEPQNSQKEQPTEQPFKKTDNVIKEIEGDEYSGEDFVDDKPVEEMSSSESSFESDDELSADE
jgi:hypothetical protein